MPIQRFDTENYVAAEDALLEYVNAVADEYAPDFAFDPDGEAYPTDSQAPMRFRHRYNSGLLPGGFNYEDYTRRRRFEESIIDVIEALGIDAEKFWYLLLFINDYVLGSTLNTLKLSKSPRQEMAALVSFVEKNEAGTDFFNQMQFHEPMTMTLKVKGRKLVIDNPTTISLISNACKESLKTIQPGSTYSLMDADNRHTTSQSVRIWLFVKMLRTFFERFPQFKGRKKSQGGFSKSTLLLISKLVYFVGLTQNEDYDKDDENIKALMKQYRDYDLDTVNKYYW